MEEYAGNILELYPHYEQVMEWAANTFSNDEIEAYDAIMASSDPSKIMPAIEEMMALYEQREDREVAFTEQQIDEYYSENLESAEPMGTEYAMEWLQLAVDSQNTDPVLSDIALATAQFHRGEADAEDLVSSILNKHSHSEILNVINSLNND